MVARSRNQDTRGRMVSTRVARWRRALQADCGLENNELALFFYSNEAYRRENPFV
jgi:hypothetical protein